MTLFSTVADDYRFEFINEAPDFAPLRQALFINPMVVIDQKTNVSLAESAIIIACKLLLEHPNYVLLELDFNFFGCPFELTHKLLEICPQNAIVVMSAIGLAKESVMLEPMTQYAEFLYAEDNHAAEKLNRKRYLSTLKSDIVRMYNIPLDILIYVFTLLLVGYSVGFALLIIERRNRKNV